MSKFGPIVIIEDDVDDKIIFEDVLKSLNYSNKLIWFDNSEETLEYLLTTNDSIFIIFSDINIPGRNGLDLKKKIDSTPELRSKSIPFVFYSTVARQSDIDEAYSKMTVQGFFKKGRDYQETKNSISLILEYWKLCKHPNMQ